MYCSKCGAELNPSDAFCARCGKPITSNSNTTASANATNQLNIWQNYQAF
ncbi:zinc-ribbon domain-containing protein [Staphylococcus carnosus]